jgi:DUF2917 family protein
MIALGIEESVRIKPSHGTRISCLSGVIWLTREGDPRDYFLTHGDCIELEPGVTMLTALEPTVLSISEHDGLSWPRRLVAALHRTVRLFRLPEKAGRAMDAMRLPS